MPQLFARRTRLAFRLAPAVVIMATGCSTGPSKVEPPSISPGGAASEAMSLFDKDGDGFIAGAELDATPGIKAAMATIDADKDGKASEDEIAARIEAWQATRYGVMATACQFTIDGKPLVDADVTFEPEPFLSSLKAAQGITNSNGSAMPSVPKDQRPAADYPPGFQLGLYRIKVSKKVNGQETIPAQFNEQTTLGQQISPDDPAVASQRVRIELKTK